MSDLDKILEAIRKIEERLSAIEARLNVVVVPQYPNPYHNPLPQFWPVTCTTRGTS